MININMEIWIINSNINIFLWDLNMMTFWFNFRLSLRQLISKFEILLFWEHFNKTCKKYFYVT